MKAISLKLPDDLVSTSEKCAGKLRVSRAEYIRQAIERMNKETQTALRADRMKQASFKVSEESMAINAEFDVIEDVTDA